MKLGRVTPILRSFDEAKAREFYVGFLGFKIDWEHRFEPGTPLYMQVSKNDCILHLSEHFGDGTPGTYVRIEISNVDEFQQQLLFKHYRHARPGVADTPWNTREMTIADPFGNKLIFVNTPVG
jgi:catechol 2,3-dioxygenase-like lactoylglutathione lyase family enzyme